MKKFLIVLAAGGAVSAFPAFAQDAATAFTGPYVQAGIGYDKARSGSDVDIDHARDTKQSIDGLYYGAGLGYDAAIGERLRVGAEAELADSTSKWRARGEPNAFNLGRVNAGRDIYVGGRLGYVMSPQTMLYVKGGYTNARFNTQATDGTTSLKDGIDADGYRIGGGVEYAVDSNVFTRLEYRYSGYKRGELDFGGNTPDSSRFDIDTDRHQVVASVGMRF